MTQFAAIPINQYRHQFVVFRLERRIGINVQHLDPEIRHPLLAAQGFQRGEHVVAQVAVVAAEEPQLRRRTTLVGSICQKCP